MFYIQEIKGVFGEKRIMIEPVFNEFYTDIKKVTMRYTEDEEKIKEEIVKFFDEKIEDITIEWV